MSVGGLISVMELGAGRTLGRMFGIGRYGLKKGGLSWIVVEKRMMALERVDQDGKNNSNKAWLVVD